MSDNTKNNEAPTPYIHQPGNPADSKMAAMQTQLSSTTGGPVRETIQLVHEFSPDANVGQTHLFQLSRDKNADGIVDEELSVQVHGSFVRITPIINGQLDNNKTFVLPPETASLVAALGNQMNEDGKLSLSEVVTFDNAVSNAQSYNEAQQKPEGRGGR